MSIDAGGHAHMTYNNNNNNNSNVNGFPSTVLGNPVSGFGARGTRLNSKRLSVALPPKIASINEDQTDIPTPRTSRSHLLAGLRTQPKTPAVPASAPYHQTHHSTQGFSYGGYGPAAPQSATTTTTFDLPSQFSMSAGRQMYSLPEQVLAPPSVYDQAEEMDPSVLQQMQMTSMFLAQRQQQLQQQLANITATAQGLNLNGSMQRGQFQQAPMAAQVQQNYYLQQQLLQQQQQLQSPIEVPGQPGVYLVFNPATNGYHAVDQNARYPLSQQQQPQQPQQPQQLQQPAQASAFSPTPIDTSLGGMGGIHERSMSVNPRSITPPKKIPSPPSTLSHVEPLPPPSATAFRRGHKKASSLAIHPGGIAVDGPKTSSIATLGSQRTVIPPAPMTGTFGPGASRAGEHPTRQPRGPPPLEELTSAPTSKHEGSKNFATRQRRRALDDLVRARTNRRGISRSSSGSPVSEGEYSFPASDAEVGRSFGSESSSRKMSPIGSEMKEKRNSRGSNDGYFGLYSASSSESEESIIFKQPLTPVDTGVPSNDRKRMMLGVLNAAEKRKTFAI